LPERLETYKYLRDQEIQIMQPVADQLQAELPQEKIGNLERSIKNALLILRHCSMAMLLNDEAFVKNRLLGWLTQTSRAYNTQTIDSTLYRLLNQQLSQVLSPQQMSLLKPSLMLVQNALMHPTSLTV
jgi:hypothetical protein